MSETCEHCGGHCTKADQIVDEIIKEGMASMRIEDIDENAPSRSDIELVPYEISNDAISMKSNESLKDTLSEESNESLHETFHEKSNENSHEAFNEKSKELLNDKDSATTSASEDLREQTREDVSEKKSGEIFCECGKMKKIEAKNDFEDFQPPSDHLAEKIVKEVESCFEDFNLMKNSFLLKHIRRNREGYVSLKLIASFRKVKSLTRDWRAVTYSLEGSEKLQMNKERTKIRRVIPVPKIEDTSFGKTVIVFDLLENSTSESLKQLFGKHGNVVQADILKQGSRCCNVYHKRCLAFYQEIASNVFGIVEYEKYDDAVRAIKEGEGNMQKENKLKVVPLMPLPYRRNQMRQKSSQRWRRTNERFKHRIEVLESKAADENIVLDKNKERVDQNILREPNYFRRGYFRRPFRGGKRASMTDLLPGKSFERNYSNDHNLKANFQNRALEVNCDVHRNSHLPREPLRSGPFNKGRFEP